MKIAVDSTLGQSAPQSIPGSVLTDRAEQTRVRAKRCKIDGDIGGTARTVIGVLHVNDRHRRLRRNTAGGAKQVLVQHDVARNDNASS